MTKTTDLSETDLRQARVVLDTNELDGKNFDRLCYAILKITQMIVDKMIMEKVSLRGRGF